MTHPQMRYNKQRYFKRKEFSDFKTAQNYARKKRKQTGCQYKITKGGLFGGWEVWLTTRYA